MHSKKKLIIEKLPYIFAFILCFFICLFLLLGGTPHYDTNDDITLNNIAIGNYGEQNRAYLVFSNICYGYLINTLYNLIPSFNWYAIFPLLLGIFCFLLIAYILVAQNVKYVNAILPLIFVVLFGKYILINFQFTHYAAFFSAIGLFLMYVYLLKFERKKQHYFFSFIGIILALIGFWMRRDAFLSVAAIFGVCCLIKAIQNKFWTYKINAILKQLLPYILLLVLIITSSTYSYMVYEKNPDWKYWTEYNTYRASLLDYPLPDYDTYQTEYEEIGLDKLDYEMLCSWNYADLNKFSLNTLKELQALQRQVKKENFVLTEVIVQFVRDLCNLFLDNTGFLLLTIVSILLIIGNSKNLWLLFPTFVMGAELFYLSFNERFIFRSYLGLWISISLIVLLEIAINLQSEQLLNKRKIFSFFLSVFTFMVPWMFEIWHEHYLIREEIDIYNENYTWRDTLSKDTDSLYVCETLFGGFPDSLAISDDISVYPHNLYSLGGWTCPAPLEQYLLEKYSVKDEGIMKGLINDEKNLYYIETLSENRHEQMLNYLRKEYSENTQVELVNIVHNINVYRFYEEPCNPKNAVMNADLLYNFDLNDTGYTIQLTGWCNQKLVEPYKQKVWIKISFRDGTETYIPCERRIDQSLNEHSDNMHIAACGIYCEINKEFINGMHHAEIIIADNEYTFAKDITESFQHYFSFSLLSMQ